MSSWRALVMPDAVSGASFVATSLTVSVCVMPPCSPDPRKGVPQSKSPVNGPSLRQRQRKETVLQETAFDVTVIVIGAGPAGKVCQ